MRWFGAGPGGHKTWLFGEASGTSNMVEMAFWESIRLGLAEALDADPPIIVLWQGAGRDNTEA